MASLNHITALMAVSAAGRVLPTFLVFERNIPGLNSEHIIPDDWIFTKSPNGIYFNIS